MGWTYLGAGVAAGLRGRTRIGALMAVFGLVWFLGNFQNTDAPLLISIGTAYEALSAGVLAHLVLAYPDGRLRRRAERAVVGSLYV